jgi:hypothetical protein
MYYGLCYSIAEMSPALPHTGGAYSFARRRWAVGRVHHRAGREHGVRHHPGGGGGAMGFLMHDIVVGLFDLVGSPWWNSPVTWWAVFYVVFVWINIIGIEATMRFTVVINILALGILASSSSRCWPRASSTPACGPTSRPTAAGPTLPAPRDRGDLPGAAVRHLVLPGHRGAAAGRRGVARPPARRPPGHHLGPAHPGRHRPGILLLNTGVDGGAASHRHLGHPAVRRASRPCSARAPRPSCWP